MKELDSIFSEADCRTILRKCFADSRQITFLWQKFESLSGDVEGYLSEHFSLKITYQEGAKTREKKFFVKAVLNQNGFLAVFAKAMDVFRKETFIYTTFFPALEATLINYKQIPPKCYFAENNVLVLEDLSEEGFHLVERLKFYDTQQCKLALKTLSYYHAYSIIYEEFKSRELGRKYRLNEEFPEELMDRFYGVNRSSPTAKFLESSIKTLIDLVNELPEDTKCKKDFAELLSTSLNGSDGQIPADKYRLTCTHCDLWSSNIMFKCDSRNGDQLIDCKIIDFQMLNYTMQAYDVELFFHGNTTSEFRRTHKMELLRYYYDSFQQILKENNIEDAQGILSFKDLEETCILRGPDAKIQAISDKSLLYLPEEILQEGAQNPDLFKTVLIDDRSKYILDIYKNNFEYRNIITMELLDLYDVLVAKQTFLNSI